LGNKRNLNVNVFPKALFVVHLNRHILHTLSVCEDSIQIIIIPGQGAIWINPHNAANISEVFVNYPFVTGTLKSNSVFINHFDRPNNKAFELTLAHLPKNACQIKEVTNISLSILGASIEIPVHSGTVTSESAGGLFAIMLDFRR
jgi:hypothetical protein